MDIATRIKIARQQAGLSQTELARLAGVTRGLVGQWETQRKRPGLDNLLRIARVTSLSVAFLTGENSQPPGHLKISAPDEVVLIMLYRRLDLRQRKNLANLLAKYCGISARRLHTSLVPGRRINTINRGFPPRSYHSPSLRSARAVKTGAGAEQA